MARELIRALDDAISHSARTENERALIMHRLRYYNLLFVEYSIGLHLNFCLWSRASTIDELDPIHHFGGGLLGRTNKTRADGKKSS